MTNLPASANLDQLRHQARALLTAARAGDAASTKRIQAVFDRLTLGAAQLVVARGYGFSSWAGLKGEVEARTTGLGEKVPVFLEASIRDYTDRAARMLAANPEIAGYSFATALVLGDADHVRAEIERDPDLATRPDARSGWTPLHAVCGSRWHRLDPARTDGLLAVAPLLLDPGADLEATIPRPQRCTQPSGPAVPPSSWSCWWPMARTRTRWVRTAALRIGSPSGRAEPTSPRCYAAAARRMTPPTSTGSCPPAWAATAPRRSSWWWIALAFSVG